MLMPPEEGTAIERQAANSRRLIKRLPARPWFHGDHLVKTQHERRVAASLRCD